MSVSLYLFCFLRNFEFVGSLSLQLMVLLVSVRVVFEDNFFNLGHTAQFLGEAERGDLSVYENELDF